jgi:hypothetical protein
MNNSNYKLCWALLLVRVKKEARKRFSLSLSPSDVNYFIRHIGLSKELPIQTQVSHEAQEVRLQHTS